MCKLPTRIIHTGLEHFVRIIIYVLYHVDYSVYYLVLNKTLCLTQVVLGKSSAFARHLLIGLSVGRSPGKVSHHHHSCTLPQEQLLDNLYVDYFHSVGPCITPEGAKVYTFRNTAQGTGQGPHTYYSVCSKVPKICQLMGRQRRHRMVEADVTESFIGNTSLYHTPTGRTSTHTPTGRTSTHTPTGRTSTHTPTQARLVSSGDQDNSSVLDDSSVVDDSTVIFSTECSHGGCSGHGAVRCDSFEDFIFPVVGRSAISNTTVTIIQSFPDLIQPVFFRKCRSQQAYGACIQEYLPLSLLVSSYSGGGRSQDLVMVESGCRATSHVTHTYRPQENWLRC
nr:uncharacterized protein LOC128698331 isoform X3 [Cherax quadricarinatus]